MKPLSKSFNRDESGAVLAFVALAIPLFIFFMALVVDLNLGRLTANKLQISADAAALAGVTQLPNKTAVDNEAIAFAVKNYKTGQNASNTSVLKTPDVYMGYWDSITRDFYRYDTTTSQFTLLWRADLDVFVDPASLDPPVAIPSDAELNAVWVRTRRDSTNALPTVFAGIAGLNSFDITKVAIAVAAGQGATGDCTGGGIFSNDKNEGNSNNNFDAYCLYGDPHVKISNDNFINDGSLFIMPDRNNYLPGLPDGPTINANTYENGTDEMVLSDDEITLELPGLVDDFFDDMRGSPPHQGNNAPAGFHRLPNRPLAAVHAM